MRWWRGKAAERVVEVGGRGWECYSFGGEGGFELGVAG